MGQKDKLVKRLKSKPRDFTFEETEQLLGCFGYGRSDKEKPVDRGLNLFVMAELQFYFINRTQGKNCWIIKKQIIEKLEAEVLL